MRARSLRTHHMGTSNRHSSINHEQPQSKTNTLMQRSFNKTTSLRGSQFGQSKILALQSTISENKCNNPFLGSHNEFQTQRFDKSNIKPYKHPKTQNSSIKKTLKLTNQNKYIQSLKSQFNGLKINMNKLKQLKFSFINNNKSHTNLKPFFQKYSTNNIIEFQGLQKLAKQYGFDINQNQAKLIFALTNQSNHTPQHHQYITIDGFVQLMTKSDIFYQTLKLQTNNFTFANNFSPPVHQVLRNKFTSIKEAFNIYKFNNQQIGKKQFDYVMKKLDLTDLVLAQQQRNQIFQQFSQNGIFNVQSLICAIAQQENILKIPSHNSQFLSQISSHKQKQFKNSNHPRQFSLNNLSSYQFQNQFKKARQIIETLKKNQNQNQSKNQKNNLIQQISQNSNFITKKQLISKIEKILKKQGINFNKQYYQAFAAYTNTDINGQINLSQLNHQIFQQTEKQAKSNFQRKTRIQPPKNQQLNPSQYINHNQAIKSFNKIISSKLNPQTRQLFKFLDQDNDGHISCKQFKQKIQSINILENWEIQNLINHFNISNKGSINFQQFSKKIIQENVQFNDLPIIQTRNSRNLTNWSEASKNKKSIIQNSKFSTYQNPSRFSARPIHLTTQDLSLISPQKPMGMHITQSDRFNNNKHDIGRNHKAKSLAITDQKIKKLAQWNSILQERTKISQEKTDQKQQARNYYLRLAQEKYQINCHQ